MMTSTDLTRWQEKPENKDKPMTYWNRRFQMARLNAVKRRAYAESLDGPVAKSTKREYKEGEAF